MSRFHSTRRTTRGQTNLLRKSALRRASGRTCFELLETRRLFTVAATYDNVPKLNSDPSASAQLYLDFVGSSATTWEGRTVSATPAYNDDMVDNDPSVFTDAELADIRQTWG